MYDRKIYFGVFTKYPGYYDALVQLSVGGIYGDPEECEHTVVTDFTGETDVDLLTTDVAAVARDTLDDPRMLAMLEELAGRGAQREFVIELLVDGDWDQALEDWVEDMKSRDGVIIGIQLKQDFDDDLENVGISTWVQGNRLRADRLRDAKERRRGGGWRETVFAEPDSRAVEFESGGCVFEADHLKKTLTLIDYLGSDESLDISGEVRGYRLTAIGEKAFSYCESLQRVSIPAGVARIGAEAFRNCGALQSASIPDSVAAIGKSAFQGCSSLKGVSIPDGVAHIGFMAFKDCSSLKSITIPGSVAFMGEWAFEGCSSLRSATIPGSITRINHGAFSGCGALRAVDIPYGICAVEYEAFCMCSSLRSVAIPESVTLIDDDAFQDCGSLECIAIPASVAEIGDGAFSGCGRLSAIEVDVGNEHYVSMEGVLFSKADRALLHYPHDRAGTTFAIPEGARRIGARAFCGCASLEKVALPGSVAEIGDDAFRDCTSLHSINIPSGVARIGESAFYGCEALQSIAIPKSLAALGGYTFHGCISLEGAELSEGLAEIGAYAFYKCESLQGIVIPEGVASVGEKAFHECISLKSITIPRSVASMSRDDFWKCCSLETIVAHDGIFQGETEIHVDCSDIHCTHAGSVTILDYMYDYGVCACKKAVAIKS